LLVAEVLPTMVEVVQEDFFMLVQLMLFQELLIPLLLVVGELHHLQDQIRQQ